MCEDEENQALEFAGKVKFFSVVAKTTMNVTGSVNCYTYWEPAMERTSLLLYLLGTSDGLVNCYTYWEPAMEWACKNMSIAFSWFAYLPLLCSKFSG